MSARVVPAPPRRRAAQHRAADLARDPPPLGAVRAGAGAAAGRAVRAAGDRAPCAWSCWRSALLWLTYLAWPKLEASGRLTRLLVVVLVGYVLVQRLVLKPSAAELFRCGTSTVGRMAATAPDLGFLFNHAGHVVDTELTAKLAELGTTPREICVLGKALGAELTQSRLGELAGLDKTTMVVTMDKLERAGLAERRPSATDRRARIVAVTPAGEKLLAARPEGGRPGAQRHAVGAARRPTARCSSAACPRWSATGWPSRWRATGRYAAAADLCIGIVLRRDYLLRSVL